MTADAVPRVADEKSGMRLKSQLRRLLAIGTKVPASAPAGTAEATSAAVTGTKHRTRGEIAADILSIIPFGRVKAPWRKRETSVTAGASM
jgi:hypothetical protein